MGGWKQEVFKMAIYISFPVLTFHYFHQPEIFEDYVIQLRRQLYPREDPETRKILEKLSNDLNTKTDLKRLEDLEATFQ